MDKPKTILVVDDEAEARTLARGALSGAGRRVLEAEAVAPAWHLFCKEKPDLVVLDVGLGREDGRELCRKIRGHAELATTPVILLTGKGGLDDKEEGFGSGADQYLVKPVDVKELRLWADALLRRVGLDAGEGDQLKAGDLVMDLKAHLVRYREQVVQDLTVKEFELLAFLVKKRPRVLSRKHILSNLWHTVAVDRLVDAHLSNLRKKLPQELSDKIQNVPGKGFRYLG